MKGGETTPINIKDLEPGLVECPFRKLIVSLVHSVFSSFGKSSYNPFFIVKTSLTKARP